MLLLPQGDLWNPVAEGVRSELLGRRSRPRVGALPSPQLSEPLPSKWLLFQQAWGWATDGTSLSSLSFLVCKMEATNPMRIERDGMEDTCGKLCPWSGHLAHVVSPSYR